MPSHTVEAFLRRFYGQHIAPCVQEALRGGAKMSKRRAGKRVGTRAIAYAFLSDLPPLPSYGDVALQRAFVDWGERSVIGKAPNEGTRYSVGRAQPLHELGSKSVLKNPLSERVNPGQLFFEVPKNGNNEHCGLLVMVNAADKDAYNAAFNPAKVAARSARSARAGGVGGVGAVGGGGGSSGGTGGDQRHYVHLQHYYVGGTSGGEGQGGGQFEGLLPGSSSSSPSSSPSSPSSSSASTPRKRQRDGVDELDLPEPVVAAGSMAMGSATAAAGGIARGGHGEARFVDSRGVFVDQAVLQAMRATADPLPFHAGHWQGDSAAAAVEATGIPPFLTGKRQRTGESRLV